MQQERVVGAQLTSAEFTELLVRGRQAVLAARYTEAAQLFEQVWAAGKATDLSSQAAWGMASIALANKNYQDAAAWFARVEIWPEQAACLWPLVRQQLASACHEWADAAPARPASAAARLPVLKLTNLGRFAVERGGQALPPSPARKATALLRYLLTRRHRSAHKDELIELLWPEAGLNEAAHSLHVAIAALRRYLDPPGASYVLFNLDHYSLDGDAPIEDDVLEFQRLCDEAEQRWRANDMPGAKLCYSSAIACYQGDYFVDDRDTSWAIALREQLLVRYLVTLDRLGRIFVMQQHYEAALDCYDMLLARDIYREDAHYQLMSCYTQLGRRREALRQYEICCQHLRRDLGLEPSEELQAFFQQLMNGGLRAGSGQTSNIL